MNDKHSEGRKEYIEANLVKAIESVLGVQDACDARKDRQSHTLYIGHEKRKPGSIGRSGVVIQGRPTILVKVKEVHMLLQH